MKRGTSDAERPYNAVSVVNLESFPAIAYSPVDPVKPRRACLGSTIHLSCRMLIHACLHNSLIVGRSGRVLSSCASLLTGPFARLRKVEGALALLDRGE